MAVANGLDKEPAFRWWVRKTLCTRDRIISKVKTRYWKKTHKYGIEMPKAVRQALAIDARNGDLAWRDAIAKEMKNVMPVFEFRDDESGKGNVPNAPLVRDTQVITSKERKCGVCGVDGHNKRRCPTIVVRGAFYVANSFSVWFLLIFFSNSDFSH
jgi:hypothetical protein